MTQSVTVADTVPSRVQNPAFSFLEIHIIPVSPNAPIYLDPFVRPLLSPRDSTAPLGLGKVFNIPVSRQLIKVLNRIGPRTEPWETQLILQFLLNYYSSMEIVLGIWYGMDFGVLC